MGDDAKNDYESVHWIAVGGDVVSLLRRRHH